MEVTQDMTPAWLIIIIVIPARGHSLLTRPERQYTLFQTGASYIRLFLAEQIGKPGAQRLKKADKEQTYA